MAHYEAVRRWSRGLALVGPEEGLDPAVRHYGESLAALDWIDAGSGPEGALVDLGSGAGFPGLVLAAARPDLPTTLVESRQRKCAFLKAAARACGLSVRVLGGRVASPLPPGLPAHASFVTLRAIRFPIPVLTTLADRLPRARWILWAGREDPLVPSTWRRLDERPLAGSRSRRILLLESR